MARNERQLTPAEKRSANEATVSDILDDIAEGDLAFCTLTVVVRDRKIHTVREDRVRQVDPEGKMD